MYVSPDEGGVVSIADVSYSEFPATANLTGSSDVAIEAIPADGYSFVGWTGDIMDNTNPATINMSCNKIVTANFVKTTYALTISVSGNGTTVPAAGTYTYDEGETVVISAIAADGWHLDSWIGSVVNANSANATVTVSSNMTVRANFVENSLPWLLIGSIIAGVVILCIVIFVPVKRRVKKTL